MNAGEALRRGPPVGGNEVSLQHLSPGSPGAGVGGRPGPTQHPFVKASSVALMHVHQKGAAQSRARAAASGKGSRWTHAAPSGVLLALALGSAVSATTRPAQGASGQGQQAGGLAGGDPLSPRARVPDTHGHAHAHTRAHRPREGRVSHQEGGRGEGQVAKFQGPGAGWPGRARSRDVP